MRILTFFSLCVSLLAACANEPGKGWAQLQGTINVEIEDLHDRLDAGGNFLTESGYVVRVDTLELALDSLRLEGGQADGPSVEVHLESPAPLLAGAEFFISPEDCEDACQILERGELTSASLALTGFVASGTVWQANATDAVKRPWKLSVPLAGESLMQAIEIPVSGEDYELEVAVHVHVESAIFDGIDWQAAATEPALPQASVDAVREVLLRSHLEVQADVDDEHGEHALDEPSVDDHGHAH